VEGDFNGHSFFENENREFQFERKFVVPGKLN